MQNELLEKLFFFLENLIFKQARVEKFLFLYESQQLYLGSMAIKMTQFESTLCSFLNLYICLSKKIAVDTCTRDILLSITTLPHILLLFFLLFKG
jgi:hypothetical protein